MASKKKCEVHVLPAKGVKGWQVTVIDRGVRSYLHIAKTQAFAIKYARKVAISYKAELVVHGRNGKIRFKNSFGNDPRKVRG